MTRIGDQRPQPAATIDANSGGFALMLPYAVIQAVAPVAKLLQEGDAVHVLMTWAKAVAPLNMSSMFVTLPVFQLPMAWLKAVAPENMPRITSPLTYPPS